MGNLTCMKLKQYMIANDLTDEAMAELLSCPASRVSVSAVRKWRYEERVPRNKILCRIVEITAGKVTWDDFMGPKVNKSKRPRPVPKSEKKSSRGAKFSRPEAA